MHKLLLPAAFLLLFSAARAQSVMPQVYASGGGFATAATFTNSFTVGELALIDTYTASGYILTQGFQQPDYGPLAVINPTVAAGFSSWPNPTQGLVNISYQLSTDATIRIDTYTIVGEMLSRSEVQRSSGPQTDPVDLSAFENGVYFIRYSLIQPGAPEQTLLLNRIVLNR